MKKEDKKQIEINNLMALANIVDNYEEFSKNLKRVINFENYNRELITKLDKISRDEFCLRDMGMRNFYKGNKEVIDTINKYSSIYDFICSCYDYRGRPFNKFNKLDYYYSYLEKNKAYIEHIKLLLSRIKELGIEKIDLDEWYDFTAISYRFVLNHYNANVVYLENIEVLPSYEKKVIEYRSIDSNYKIVVEGFNEQYSDNEIFVNSLLFDVDSLPKNISKKEILDKIIELKKANIDEDLKVREAIELSVALDDLEGQYVRTNSIISKLDGVENKQELKRLLINILDNIGDMREIENAYYQDIFANSTKINQKRLVREKKLYLEKRYLNELDLD